MSLIATLYLYRAKHNSIEVFLQSKCRWAAPCSVCVCVWCEVANSAIPSSSVREPCFLGTQPEHRLSRHSTVNLVRWLSLAQLFCFGCPFRNTFTLYSVYHKMRCYLQVIWQQHLSGTPTFKNKIIITIARWTQTKNKSRRRVLCGVCVWHWAWAPTTTHQLVVNCGDSRESVVHGAKNHNNDRSRHELTNSQIHTTCVGAVCLCVSICRLQNEYKRVKKKKSTTWTNNQNNEQSIFSQQSVVDVVVVKRLKTNICVLCCLATLTRLQLIRQFVIEVGLWTCLSGRWFLAPLSELAVDQMDDDMWFLKKNNI